eukprot:scaffold270211_cov28-Tisochrysis_lutea.AAC.2
MAQGYARYGDFSRSLVESHHVCATCVGQLTRQGDLPSYIAVGETCRLGSSPSTQLFKVELTHARMHQTP